MSLARAEAEASTPPLKERLQRQQNKYWIKMNMLPKKHPLTIVIRKMNAQVKHYGSPLCTIADWLSALPAGDLRRVDPFCIAPWSPKVHVDVPETEQTEQWTKDADDLLLLAGNSYKNGNIGLGLHHEVTVSNGNSFGVRQSLKVGNKHKAQPAEIGVKGIDAAVTLIDHTYREEVVRRLGYTVSSLKYMVVSTNRAAVQAVPNTRGNRHQAELRCIHSTAEEIQKRGGPKIRIRWTPASAEVQGNREAARLAKEATSEPLRPLWDISQTEIMKKADGLIVRTSRWLNQDLDTALPEKHTKAIYDQLTAKEAAVLCQLRTGKNRLNSYLATIEAKESDRCECDMEREETVAHFLFECPQWETQRRALRGEDDTWWRPKLLSRSTH